jgi:hypothetical protein
MADYLTARAKIAEIIGGVAITTPVSVSLAGKVSETLPTSVDSGVYPSLTITGYMSRYLRGPSSKRERIYNVTLRLMVKSVPPATPQEVLEALKEAIGTAFDGSVTLDLGAGYHVVEGPNWILREPVEDAGTMQDEGEIIVKITDVAAFAA